MVEYIKRILAKAEFTGNFQDAYPTCQIHALIDSIPAADVVERDCFDRLLAENDELRERLRAGTPVRIGRWVKARGSWCTPGGDPVWECSECGKGIHVYGIEHGTYGKDVADGQWVACPNCGAIMEDG